MRRWWVPFSIVVLVLVLISVLGGIISRQMDRTEALPGWVIIRPPHELSSLVEQNDIIWAGGRDGVFALDRDSGDLLYELQDEGSFQYVRALLGDSQGNLWIGHQGGLSCYDGFGFTHYDTSGGLPHPWVTCLLEDGQGTIWAGTFGGAFSLSEGGFTVLGAEEGLMADMVNVMAEDNMGGLWFGSFVAPKGGLSYLKDNRWQYFSVANGLPHNNINALLQDDQGAIWVATGYYNRGGAAKLVYDPGLKKWEIEKLLDKKTGMAGEKVRSVYQDRLGNYWFGSEYDGIARHYGDQWEIFTIRQGLSDNEVKAILQDYKGNLWLGTHDGITLIRAGALDELQ